MNKQFRRGLVVGKFSPLHHGHELVIRRALDLCDEVVIISFLNPEFPGCDAARRGKWLAELFPSTRRLIANDELLRALRPAEFQQIPSGDDDELTHRRFVGFLCLRALGAPVDAVFTSETYGEGFAAELTRYFREHAGCESQVAHVLVDGDRTQVPISGTQVRRDVHAYREYLSPIVYTSFVKKVCILGGESSGKSTLAAALAARFGTVHVEEYGRELWERNGGTLVFSDMLHIAETQVNREEEALLNAFRFLFCDTSPLTTLFYSRHMFGRSDVALERLAERSYDLVVLCSPDIPFVQDGTRQPDTFREDQHRWYLQELQRRSISYLRVTGNLEQRLHQVSQSMQNVTLGDLL